MRIKMRACCQNQILRGTFIAAPALYANFL